MKYIVEYGSSSKNITRITSDSRDARRHGQNLLGSAGGGFVRVATLAGQVLSEARYTPKQGGAWRSVVPLVDQLDNQHAGKTAADSDVSEWKWIDPRRREKDVNSNCMRKLRAGEKSNLEELGASEM